MTTEVNFRIVLLRPPAGVLFGLQKGSGSDYETVQTQRSGTQDLAFQFQAKIKVEDNGFVNLLGPFVQGPKNGRFVYIDIGSYAGEKGTQWSRRLKIPLTGISQKDIKAVQMNTASVLESKVEGKGKDGTPACGTAKPFKGWHIAGA